MGWCVKDGIDELRIAAGGAACQVKEHRRFASQHALLSPPHSIHIRGQLLKAADRYSVRKVRRPADTAEAVLPTISRILIGSEQSQKVFELCFLRAMRRRIETPLDTPSRKPHYRFEKNTHVILREMRWLP